MKVKVHSRPDPLDVDLRSAAIVVVDMQNSFIAKGGVFDLAGIDIAPAAQIIPVIRGMLDRARTAGITVVYLQMGYKDDLSNSGGENSPNWHKEFALLLLRKGIGLTSNPLAEGSWGFSIVEELKPQPGDLVVVKSRYSGFAGTQLDSLLRTRGIRHLFFAGIATNVCVESTLRDAYFLDYWPFLITDATAQAGPAYLKQATVENVENHFGWTLNSQEFLDCLSEKSSGELGGQEE